MSRRRSFRPIAVSYTHLVLGRHTKIRSAAVYGGVGKGPQIAALQRGTEIIVACPGRLLDHIHAGDVDLSHIEVLVLDEADRMLDMGFLPDIRRILKHVPAQRQTMLFSATMPPDIRSLADSILTDPATVQVEDVYKRQHYHTANRMLGTADNPCLWPAGHTLKAIADDLGQGHTFETTGVGIYFGERGVTVQDPFFGGDGPTRTGCLHCGGCMVGCRHNAKNTLDKNYLYLAEKYGAEVLPERNVRNIRPLYGAQADGARYEVAYEKITDWTRKGRGRARARNVIVSAGVVGTVELLLKCRDEDKTLPRLSPMLGEHVRSNSEALMGVTARDQHNFAEGVAISSHFWADEVTSVEPCRYPPGSGFMRTLIWPLEGYGDEGTTFVGRLWASLRHLFHRPGDFLHCLLYTSRCV